MLNNATKRRARELLASGQTRNEIARELGVPVRLLGGLWPQKKPTQEVDFEMSEREMLEKRLEMHRERGCPEDSRMIEELTERLRALE